MEFNMYYKASELQKAIRAKESEITTLRNAVLQVNNLRSEDHRTLYDIKICKTQLLTIASYNMAVLEGELKELKQQFKNL